jgi:biopolymer transport protein ExbD
MAVRAAPAMLEPDMVPLIDIVTLLLLFLIVVGDMAAKVSTVRMRLPSADQAKSEKDWPVKTENRVVIQMWKDDTQRYWAVVESHKYTLGHRGESGSLTEYLTKQVNYRLGRGECRKDEKTGEVTNFPVKLRLPAEAPMEQVERVLFALARAGLVDVHFAAEPGRRERGK